MNESSSLHNTLNPWRIYAFGGILLVVFMLYAVRLYYYQVVEYDLWMEQADTNRTSRINIPAQRGIIYDRNGIVLARNIASYNIVITPVNLPDDEGEIQRIYRELSPIIDLPVNRSELNQETSPYVPCLSNHGITQIVLYGDTNAPYSPVKIKCDVTPEVAMLVKERSVDWPGVDVEITPLRDYPTGSLTAAVVGYMGPISAATEEYYRGLGFDPNRDKVGYAGIERAYQDVLAGKNGVRTVERDVAGKVIRDLGEPIPAIPGSNVRVTIDTRLQLAVESILVDQMDYWNRLLTENRQMTSGAAIVMNPKTGEILAMVSFPSYENNRLARFIPATYYNQLVEDARAPLLNHAVGDVLPTGSVFKLVTAVGALNEGVVSPSQIVETPGIINVTERFAAGAPGRVVPFYDHNWQKGGFGRLDFVHGLAKSSNVYFYKLGGGFGTEVPEGLGICRLGTYAHALGYGNAAEYAESLGMVVNRTRDPNAEGMIIGTGLPDEEYGLVPDPDYKRRSGESWTIGDTYLVSVGQGYVLSTPLQVLISANVIAADGKLMEPTVLGELVDGEGNIIQSFEPRVRWDITKDPVIKVYEPEYGLRGCEDADTLERTTVDPWVIKKVQEGMRLAVTDGTLSQPGLGYQDLMNIAVAGKTGTAEYCDKWAILARGGAVCDRGNWPTHAWTVAYAPYDNPEIAVVVFVYNGGEGATTAGHPIQRIIRAYFQLKAYDSALASP
jgi:penicillin-binding protein 2